MKYLVVSILVFLFAFALGAQSTLQGRVIDSLNNPIQFANVIINIPDTDKLIAFDITKADGSFSIEFSDTLTSIEIQTSALGYTTVKKQIPSSQFEEQLILKMYAGAFDIEEVVVETDRLPMTESNDTMTYSAYAFRDSTEYSIEDLIKKLPGVEVAENGSIKVNGKLVEKVLIEGDDLMGSQYAIGTRSIQAEAIGSIQVIDNYLSNPILKDVVKSDQLVMNLSLKDDYKNVISGDVGASGGIGLDKEPRYGAHLTGFLISKTYKTLAILDANSIGYSKLGDMTGNYGSLGNTSFDLKRFIPTKQFELGQLASAGSEPNRLTTASHIQSAHVAQIIPLNERHKLTVIGSGHHQTKQYGSTESSEVFASDTTRLSSINNLDKSSSALAALELRYAGFNHELTSGIEAVARYEYLPLKINNRSQVFDSVLGSDTTNYFQTSKTNLQSIYSALELTQKLRTKKVVTVSGYVSILNNPEVYETDNSPYAESIGIINGNLLRDYKNRSTETGLFSSFIVNVKQHTIRIQVGGQLFQNSFLYSSESESQEDLFSRYSLSSLVQHTFLRDRFELTSSVQPNLSIQQTKTRKNNLLALQPNLRLKYAMSKKSVLRLNTSIRQSLPNYKESREQSWQLYDQYIQLPLSEIKAQTTFRANSTIRYKNLTQGNFAFARVDYQRSVHAINRSTRTDSIQTQSGYFYSDQNSSLQFSCAAERLVDPIMGRVKIGFSNTSSQFENEVNDIRSDVSTNTSSITVDYGSYFSGPFNWGVRSTFSFQNTQVEGFKNRQRREYVHELRFRSKPIKRMHFGGKYTVRLSTARDGITYRAMGLDLNARYTLLVKNKGSKAEKKYSLWFNAYNLLNVDQQNQVFISDISRTIYSEQIIPAYFTCGFSKPL